MLDTTDFNFIKPIGGQTDYNPNRMSDQSTVRTQTDQVPQSTDMNQLTVDNFAQMLPEISAITERLLNAIKTTQDKALKERLQKLNADITNKLTVIRHRAEDSDPDVPFKNVRFGGRVEDHVLDALKADDEERIEKFKALLNEAKDATDPKKGKGSGSPSQKPDQVTNNLPANDTVPFDDIDTSPYISDAALLNNGVNPLDNSDNVAKYNVLDSKIRDIESQLADLKAELAGLRPSVTNNIPNTTAIPDAVPTRDIAKENSLLFDSRVASLLGNRELPADMITDYQTLMQNRFDSNGQETEEFVREMNFFLSELGRKLGDYDRSKLNIKPLDKTVASKPVTADTQVSKPLVQTQPADFDTQIMGDTQPMVNPEFRMEEIAKDEILKDFKDQTSRLRLPFQYMLDSSAGLSKEYNQLMEDMPFMTLKEFKERIYNMLKYIKMANALPDRNNVIPRP